MYLVKITSNKMEMMEASPFGPGFTEEEAHKADTMEIHGTGFDEAGEYCLFVLKQGERTFAIRQIEGY